MSVLKCALLTTMMLAAAPLAHAQVSTVDRITERPADAADLRAGASNFDFVDLARQEKRSALESPADLRKKLLSNDVCGKDRTGDPAAAADEDSGITGVCAVLVQVYEEAGTGKWYAAVHPVFALEAPKFGSIAKKQPESALIIGNRKLPVLVKFKDILPAKGEAIRFDGSPNEWRYTFSYAIGKAENAKRAVPIPSNYFDPNHYR